MSIFPNNFGFVIGVEILYWPDLYLHWMNILMQLL
jgi:hypothetical protein